MAVCELVPSIDSIPSDIIAFLDCQAQTLGSRGYLALAANGSSVSLLLTALLTIFVALLGYRMLLSGQLTLREGTFALLKIGAVLAFASSWPAYQTVIYDVVLRTPADLVAEVGSVNALPGAAGGLAMRLDGVDHAFRTLAGYGVGVQGINETMPVTPVNPPMFAGFDTFALGASRMMLLASALGAFTLVRLAAGLLLAFGPLFLAFLLFETTRGLFLGWMRGLVATTLGATVSGLVLAIELALLEPWLAMLIGRRMSGLDIVGAPVGLIAVVLVFAVTLALLLLGGFWLTLAWRLPTWWPALNVQALVNQALDSRSGQTLTGGPNSPTANRSRATAIADSIAAVQRREERAYVQTMAVARGTMSANQMTNQTAADRSTSGSHIAPLSQSLRRRTSGRASAGAKARDARS